MLSMDNKRKRGPRPYSDKTEVFYARCNAATKLRLEGVLLGRADSESAPKEVPVAVPDREQIQALLSDVDRLDKEKAYWRDRALKAEKRAAELEACQTG